MSGEERAKSTSVERSASRLLILWDGLSFGETLLEGVDGALGL